MMETPALVAAFVAMVPLMLFVMVTDLKRLKIPNIAVLLALMLFVVTGLWGLPLDVFAWRLAHGAIALVLGFAFYAIAGGNVGAGDMKLIAALTPFVPGAAATTVLLLFCLSAIALLLVHQVVRLFTRRRETGWKAIDQAVYLPVGVALGITMLIFLGLSVADRFAAA